MSKHTTWRLIDWGISLILGLATWFFFGICYRHHLHYQEQMQLFLTTPDYFETLIVRPGGLAIYIGRFVTQFFYDSILGGALIAGLLVLLQRIILAISYFIARKPIYALLSCLPSLGYIILLLDENYLFSGLVALILSMAVLVGYIRLKSDSVRMVSLLIMIPLLYWFVGWAVITVVLFCLWYEWVGKKQMKRSRLWATTLVALFIYLVSPFIAKMIVPQYPLIRFWLAGDYYRYVMQYPLLPLSVFLLAVIIPLLYRWLPDKNSGKVGFVHLGGQSLLCILLGGYGLTQVADWNKEEIMAYDFYSRTQKWDQIIRLADKKSPDGPLTVATLNLALSKKGYLPEYMFTYYQNGIEGLLPSFNKEYIADMMTGEIYYHLGLINTAQRFAFEAMEAIPDYQKSVRVIKRLAETNLINGAYEVAAKYLHTLQHTIIYRTWADETLRLLTDERIIDTHPEYGRLRRIRPQEDFFFSEGEKDMILGMLYEHNHENRMAYEYLLAYTLLVKDLQRFMDYYWMGEQVMAYPVTPRGYQEAMTCVWQASGQQTQATLPPQIDRTMMQRFESFRNMQRSVQYAEPLINSQFGDTYWYYLYYRK
ncbi:DUF6057 family protein [Parabacteroides sp. PF5-9]|uniref:DUF6057 family protein n=1 Tax=Parabacteroides sp. PF5-9 TaxID=1742404 RepID=UPI002474D258|nr:DUF6057 family protein [Parabacteroides sp. PF5-9]MDH6356596.1 hypothetical protein [Parabacteroides sp. PF5-9]